MFISGVYFSYQVSQAAKCPPYQPLGEETPLGIRGQGYAQHAAVKTLLALFSLENKEWPITFIFWFFLLLPTEFEFFKKFEPKSFSSKDVSLGLLYECSLSSEKD